MLIPKSRRALLYLAIFIAIFVKSSQLPVKCGGKCDLNAAGKVFSSSGRVSYPKESKELRRAVWDTYVDFAIFTRQRLGDLLY